MSCFGPGAMVADAWSSWTEPVSVQRCPELEAGSVSSGGSALAGGDPPLPGAGPRGGVDEPLPSSPVTCCVPELSGPPFPHPGSVSFN